MSDQPQRKLTPESLRQFTGDLERYRHPLNRRVLYTPGVQYLAEEGEAYWLLDAIVSYFGSQVMTDAIKADSRLAAMQFWRLEVDDDRSAVLSAIADSGEEPFVTQVIPWTDFPLQRVDVWAGFDGRHWTLYLPSEH